MNPQPAQPGLTETLAPERGAGRNVRAHWLAWSLCLLCVALAGACLIFSLLNGHTLYEMVLTGIPTTVILLTQMVSFSVVGALIASHRPDNPIGWLFLAAALFYGIQIPGEEYAVYALLTNPASLVPQERAYLDGTSGLYFAIDLVLRDTSTGKILCVLDTKYKDTATPATDDIAQIVAYAEKMGCQEAILVYPRGLPRPFEARVGDIRVRSLSFSVEGDVDEAGHRFMRTALGDALVYG